MSGLSPRRERRIVRVVLIVAGAIVAIGIGFFVLLYFTFERGGDLNRAVADAINAPGGGDYARAVALVRGSDRPESVKRFMIGQLVVDAHDHAGTRRPPETLGQGLRMIETAATTPGEARDAARRQLADYFERGVGTPPDRLTPDAAVARCWRGLATNAGGDPQTCVTLRRTGTQRDSSNGS